VSIVAMKQLRLAALPRLQIKVSASVQPRSLARLERMASFPLIECRGSPTELGRETGVALAPRIQRSLARYVAWFGRLCVSVEQLEHAGAQVLAVLEATLPHRAEELVALAEGAAVTPVQVAMLSARSELLSTWAPGLFSECTSIGLAPELANGRPLLAQSWDWFLPMAEGMGLRRARPEGEPAFLAFAEAGQLAKAGINEAGLAVALNFLELPAASHGRARQGLPVHLLVRELLACETVAGALARLKALPRGGACNLLLADATGEVLDVEVTPDRLDLLLPAEGAVSHANDFEAQTPSRRRPTRAPRSLQIWSQAVQKASQGPLDAHSAFSLLQDHGPAGEPICAHGMKGDAWAESASLAALVYAPKGDAVDARPTLWVSRGPPCQHSLQRFGF
jgi:isopenicillin-N N-acyltransferase-like protein